MTVDEMLELLEAIKAAHGGDMPICIDHYDLMEIQFIPSVEGLPAYLNLIGQ